VALASGSLQFYKLISIELDKSIKSSKNEVWEIIDKDYILSLNNELKDKINFLREKGDIGLSLTSEIPLSEPVELRMKHIFSIFTFIRWFNIYF